MSIWFKTVDLKELNKGSSNTMIELLEIEFTEIGDNYLVATMPVNHKTVQPQRILHGGASVVLAETIGSVGSLLVSNPETTKAAVGVEINANHLRPAFEGDIVTARLNPIKIGRKIHVWEIKIFNQKNDLCCISRFTATVLPKQMS